MCEIREGQRFWGAAHHVLTRALGQSGGWWGDGWSGLGRGTGQREGRAVPAGSSELGLRAGFSERPQVPGALPHAAWRASTLDHCWPNQQSTEPLRAHEGHCAPPARECGRVPWGGSGKDSGVMHPSRSCPPRSCLRPSTPGPFVILSALTTWGGWPASREPALPAPTLSLQLAMMVPRHLVGHTGCPRTLALHLPR